MATVEVLLSTYRGERWLPQLLDSVLRQSHRDLVVRVRDDGSSDGTLRLLREYEARDTRLRVTAGENVGVIRSFFTLLGQASPASDYYAFCDQDDIWLEDKVEAAVRTLSRLGEDEPLLYCCRVQYMDEQQRRGRLAPVPRRLEFANALVENVVQGATLVMNRATRELALCSLGARARMHDWWLYLTASAFGKVLYDSEVRMLYRQHDQNVIGVPSSRMRHLAQRVRRFLDAGAFRPSDQAREFLHFYGDRLSGEQRRLLLDFLEAKSGMRGRLRLATRLTLRRQRAMDNLLLRGLILSGRI